MSLCTIHSKFFILTQQVSCDKRDLFEQCFAFLTICWILEQLPCPIVRNIPWFLAKRTRHKVSSAKDQAIFRAILQVNGKTFLWFFFSFILFLVDTLDSSYAMALLPLACEPLEYLRGRFTRQEKQQDRVCRNLNTRFPVFILWHLFFPKTCIFFSKHECSIEILPGTTPPDVFDVFTVP